MAENDRNFIIFHTDLFLWKQADDQIDQWFVGGDCAGWLYARLLPLNDVRDDLGPCMEDWGGWYSSLRIGEPEVRVALLTYAWFETTNHWLIHLDPIRKLFRRQSDATVRQAVDYVADGIDQIIAADDRFTSLGWQELNPFDTGFTVPDAGE